MITDVQPGDVLAVRTGGRAGWWIRLGAALKDLPSLENHIAVLHHQAGDGTWWCVEGRPGGVGWANASSYLKSPYTLTNRNQPKTQGQRDAVCAITEAMLHTPYDWPAIAGDAIADLHLPLLWPERWNAPTPGHVVCSSLAAWAYDKAALKAPAGSLDIAQVAYVQPGDWARFMLMNSYE